jgi:hypothetical protein
VIDAAELLDELALLLEQLRRGRDQPVLGDDVDGDEVALRALRDPAGAADEPLAVARAGEGDEHALARLPGLLDPVPSPVLGEALVDAVGQPGERELAERGEVPRPEVVGEGGVDPLRRIDVAAGEAVAERERRQVDELQLVRATDDLVGDRLALLDRRDLLDHVVERLEVLDVERGDDVDAGREQLLDVLPALLVP